MTTCSDEPSSSCAGSTVVGTDADAGVGPGTARCQGLRRMLGEWPSSVTDGRRRAIRQPGQVLVVGIEFGIAISIRLPDRAAWPTVRRCDPAARQSR
jgi:hypothetical protein